MQSPPPWTVTLEAEWPVDGLPWRLALEVNPRARTVCVGPRMPGTGGLEIQAGAAARSFYERGHSELRAAGEWLRGEEAQALLAELESGYQCETLWSGDLSATWTDEAWEAGRALYEGVAARLDA